MDKKLIVTLSVIIFYVIFCGLFIKFYDKASNRGTRFCSSNTEEYSNEVLFDAFKESNFSKIWKDHDNDDKEYLKIYRGRPLCGGLEYISTNSVLSDEHYDYSYRGIIILNKQIYDYDRYCIDKSDDFSDGWKLMVCHRDVLFHRIFHLAVIILSILLFGFIIYAHGYYKELRDFKGKTVIGLTLAEILAYLTYSWRFLSYDELDNFIRAAFLMGLLQILLWITVLTVHEFIVFKNFKQPTQSEQKFTRYAVIEIIFTILFTIFILFRRSSEAGEFFMAAFFLIYAFNAIMLIAIGIKMFILSRHMTQSDQGRFDDEKKWFWIIVKLSLITLITWPFQFLSWPIHFSLYGFITKDILVLITAISIGFILLGRKKVKSTVFGNYRLVNINKA